MTYMNNAMRWVVFSARPCRSVCMYALRKHQYKYVLCISSHAAHSTFTATEMSVAEYILAQLQLHPVALVNWTYQMHIGCSCGEGASGCDKVAHCSYF